MLTIREVIKTFYNALLQRLKKHRGNWEQNDPTADDYIKNRPFYTDENGKTVKLDKKYLPDLGLAPVATSGNYNDLENRPTIYTDVVRYNTSQSLTTAQKTQARTNIGAAATSDLATVANTGDYNDLSNRPCYLEIEMTPYLGVTNKTVSMSFVNSKVTNVRYGRILSNPATMPVNGTTYHIIYNGIEYNVTSNNPANLLGNKSLYSSSYENTGEPFAVLCDPANLWLYHTGTATSATISIYTITNKDIKQLSEELIPDTIARVSELPQSDWSVHDESNLAHIKNRIAYEDALDVLMYARSNNSSPIHETLPSTKLVDNTYFMSNFPITTYIIHHVDAPKLIVVNGMEYSQQILRSSVYGWNTENMNTAYVCGWGNLALLPTNWTATTFASYQGTNYNYDSTDNGANFALVYSHLILSNGTHTTQYYLFSNEEGYQLPEVYTRTYSLKQLDEKFIPSTIARTEYVDNKVSDLINAAPEALDTLKELSTALGDDPNFATTVLTELSNKANKTDIVQANWSQNDNTQNDFIKNKPFYSESTSLMKTASFTIGEDLTEQKIFENFIFIEDQIYSVSFGDKIYKCTAWKSSVTGYYVIGNGYIYDGTDNGEDVPFACAANPYGDCYVFVKEPGSYSIIIAGKEKIVQLDEKYIPDTIARIEDIPTAVQPDWNQHNETEQDYIKNRPFYHHIKTWELTEISQELSSTSVFFKDLYGLYNTEIDFDSSKLYRIILSIDAVLDEENNIVHTFDCKMDSTILSYTTYSVLSSVGTLNINSIDYIYTLRIIDASGNGNIGLQLTTIPSGTKQTVTGFRIQLDEILPIEECVIPDAIARAKNIPIVDSTLSIEGAAAEAKTVGEKIIAPKPYITMVDQVSGHIYIVSIENGNLVSRAGIKQITVTTPPNLTEYMHGEYFDPTGMVVTATYSDDTTVDIVEYTYPTSFLKADVPPKISYTDAGITYDAVIPITINAFDPSIVLIDFIYTDNKDGTYTLLEWKGTYNGEPSDKLVIPNYACIIV